MDTIIQNSRSRVIHKSKATEFSKPVHRRKRWKEVKGTSEKGARWHSRQQVRDPDDRCACYSAKIPSLSFRRTTQTQRTLISIRVAVQIHKTQARLKHLQGSFPFDSIPTQMEAGCSRCSASGRRRAHTQKKKMDETEAGLRRNNKVTRIGRDKKTTPRAPLCQSTSVSSKMTTTQHLHPPITKRLHARSYQSMDGLNAAETNYICRMDI